MPPFGIYFQAVRPCLPPGCTSIMYLTDVLPCPRDVLSCPPSGCTFRMYLPPFLRDVLAGSTFRIYFPAPQMHFPALLRNILARMYFPALQQDVLPEVISGDTTQPSRCTSLPSCGMYFQKILPISSRAYVPPQDVLPGHISHFFMGMRPAPGCTSRTHSPFSSNYSHAAPPLPSFPSLPPKQKPHLPQIKLARWAKARATGGSARGKRAVHQSRRAGRCCPSRKRARGRFPCPGA